MKCREFERNLPDWQRGQLSAEQAARMEAHRRGCLACDRAAQSERDLRDSWQALPPLPDAPDFWPRLAQHLAAPPPALRFRFARPLAFALSTTAALGACCLLLRLQLHSVPTQGPGSTVVTVQPTSPVDENRVVRLVSELHHWPESAGDAVLTETQPYRQDERFILLGSAAR